MIIFKAIENSGLPKQPLEIRDGIDAVLFTLWAQGHQRRSFLERTSTLILSKFIGLLVWVVFLPSIIVKESPRLVYVLSLVLLAQAVFDLESEKFPILFVFGLFLVFRESITHWVRVQLFDLADIVLLGNLSKRYAKKFLSLGPLRYLEDNSFKIDIYTARILTSGTYMEETDALHDYVKKIAERGEWEKLNNKIDNFWNLYPENEQYWRLSLSET